MTTTINTARATGTAPPRRRNALPLSYRLAVLSRLGAAALGGYALAIALPALLSRVLPMPRAEAVMTSLLLSFAIYVCAVLWAFAARNAYRAWLGLLAPALACGMVWWLLGVQQ